MSGIELAGLILGAIPLAIAALEHYEDGLGKVKAFWKWEDELSSAIRTLYLHSASYELSIKILMSSVASENELRLLLTDPVSELWVKGDMDERLEDRLCSTYSAFQFTINDIQASLKEIIACLNLDRAANASADDLKAVIQAHPRAKNASKAEGFQFKKRIKFTMKKQKVKRLLDQMEQSIGRLDNFNDKADKLEPYHSGRKSKFSAPLHRIQQSALSLHRAFSQVSQCIAHVSHATNLRLEQRVTSSKRKGMKSISSENPENSTTFLLSFSHGPPYDFQKSAEVCVYEQEEPDVNTQSKVKIALPDPTPSTRSKNGSHKSLAEIADICTTLGSHLDCPCAGFCLDANGILTGVYPSQQLSLTNGAELVSLHDLLQDSHGFGFSSSLTKEECYVLSITLVSSILQLQSTPWLRDCWSKRDISFVKQTVRRPDGSEHERIDVRQPYLVHVRHSGPPTSQTSIPETDSSKLLALGVMLLEIYFKTPIERVYPPDRFVTNAGELENLGVVKTWVSREKGNLSWAFQTAISHCLRCFADPCADLQEPDFKQGFIDQVLMPLQDELSLWTSGPTRS